MISMVLNHLWQSTLVVLLAGLLTLTLRKNQASARYSIWFAASLKFLLPFSLLIGLGQHLGWLTATAEAPQWTVIISNIARPASIQNVLAMPRSLPSVLTYGGYLLGAAWLVGFFAVINQWAAQWREIKSSMHGADNIDIGAAIETRSSASILEPGVVGIQKPILLLPSDFAQRLPPEQLRAILAHEMSHVRRHDNLTGALHMVVEALFWFYPLVWWLGARLVAERERACDEEVLHTGNDPQTYAEAILNVCKHYVASPLACASGVSGSDLTRRIEYIVANRVTAKLSVIKKLLVTAAGSAVIAGPLLTGLFETRLARAQSEPASKADAISARGDVKDARPGHDEPEPATIDASSMDMDSGKEIIVMKGLRFRTGSFFLTADRAVMPQGAHNSPVFTVWTLTGNVEVHFPQGDLRADSATLNFKHEQRLLALVTANGNWVEAADQPGKKTKTRNGEALQIQYDVPNNAIDIAGP